MRLNEQQLRFFHTFGFIAFPGLLKDRIDAVINEFEVIWAKNGGGHNGKPHDGKARSCMGFIYQTEYMATLLDDPRLVGIASSLLGDDYNVTGGDGNYYVGDTGWHSDGWSSDLKNIKIAFYLDPLTKNNGCLRVIPGSHKTGDSFAQELQRDLGGSQEKYGMSGRDIPAMALETTPGDILVFNHNTKHAAFGGGNKRRMFTMNCGERYPEHRIGELRKGLEGAARFWVTEAYHSACFKNASPERLKHLQQIRDNFDHVPELARKAMAEMAEPARG